MKPWEQGTVSGRRAALPLMLILSLQGCEDDSDLREGFEVLEREGQRVVLNHSPEFPAGSWRLSAHPRVEIGETTGDEPYLFERIVHAHSLPAGEIVILDAGANRIRVFSPEGSHLRTLGRAGEGPGEFQNVIGVHLIPGDTLVLVEFSGRHLFFSPDGTFDRTWRSRLVPGPSHMLGGDRFLWPQVPQQTPPGGSRPRRGVVLGTSTGPGRDTVAVLTGGQVFAVGAEAGISNVSAPFTEETLLTVDRLGRVITSGDGYELVIRDLAVREDLRVRFHKEPRSVTQADWDQAKEHELERALAARLPGVPSDIAGAFRAQWVNAIEEAFVRMERPSQMPAFDELYVDPAGRIWAREYVAPGTTPTNTEWWVVDRDGRWVTNVLLPGDLDVLEIGEGHLIVRSIDELGVHRVRVYDLWREG